MSPRSDMAVWPPMPTEDELTIPRLSHNGQCVEGWVMAPAGKLWQPHDRDPLLWRPPNAVKSTDVDQAGSLTDVTWDIDETKAFVTAEIAKHNKYLDVLRSKVRSGTLKLTAFLAKMLGIAFDEDAVQLTERTGSGTLAYRSTAGITAKALVDEGRRLAGLPRDADTGLPVLSGRATDEARIKAIAADAARKFAATGDYAAAVAEVVAGVERTRAK